MGVNASGSNQQTPKRGSRAATYIGGVAAGLIVIGGVAYGADVFLSKDAVPRGVTVGGVEIGGLDEAAAVAKLENELESATSKSVTVSAGNLSTTFVPEQAGMSIDWRATVLSAGRQSMNPITRISSFFSTHEIDPATKVDEAVFTPALEQIHAAVAPAAVEGGLNINGGTVNVEPVPADGQEVDVEELKTAVTNDWLKPEGVQVDATTTHPVLGPDAIKAVQEGDAAKAVAGGAITARGREGIDGVIPVERLAEVVTFVPDGKNLRTDINVEAAQAILGEGLGQTEKERRNAAISFSGGSKSVTPSQDGVHVDWALTMDGFADRVLGDAAARTFDAVYIDEPATFTTEQANAATFDQTVGTFSTSGFSGPSGTNIQRVAQMVNGAIVAPGDTFSLNGYTGPRGTAQGFVESGIILNGHADTAVGGGISQFATTLYNAAYFAGMEDVAHTAHSYYISRYPAGREATVYEGAIDLQFKNTSQYPVRIDTAFDGASITVSLMGVKTVEVESINGGRWNYTAPNSITLSGADCSPSTGAQGFTTSDTRVIRDLSGTELSRETTTTVYDPSPIVTCS